MKFKNIKILSLVGLFSALLGSDSHGVTGIRLANKAVKNHMPRNHKVKNRVVRNYTAKNHTDNDHRARNSIAQNHTNNSHKDYILVHGAWHGSWCWHKVVKRLEALGHKAIALDLPGHFHNKYNPQEVTLEKYVKYVEDLINKAQQPVVLVGHSMAGVVITQVAENMPDKIDNLIYVSAFIPKNGGSLIDEEKQATIPSVATEVTIDEKAGLILLNPSIRIREFFLGNCSNEDAEYALSHLQPQPLRPFVDPISISDERFGRVPKLYIKTLKDKAIMPQDQKRMYSRIKCDVIPIDSDHSPFFCADEHLVNLMCNLKRGPRHLGREEDDLL